MRSTWVLGQAPQLSATLGPALGSSGMPRACSGMLGHAWERQGWLSGWAGSRAKLQGQVQVQGLGFLMYISVSLCSLNTRFASAPLLYSSGQCEVSVANWVHRRRSPL